MNAPISQLILDFEQVASAIREAVLRLRLYRSEQELIERRRGAGPVWDVQLPRPVERTVLMTPDGWQQKPRLGWQGLDLGSRMWQGLPGDVRGQILGPGGGEPLRVAVRSTSSGIDDVPWEWLNGGPEAVIAAHDQIRFVRLVPAPFAPPPLTVAGPLRVLLVVTNPKDERLLQPGAEIAVVQKGVESAGGYDLELCVGPSMDGLQEALHRGPHILHYIGHSGIDNGTGHIILHGDRDVSRWVGPPELSAVLPPSVRLLCLSTCVTAENYQAGGLAKFAHCCADTPLPTTIVNQYAITPQGASVFWGEFYPALLDCGGNVVEALHRARMAVYGEKLDTLCWAGFSLVVRDGTGHPLRLAASAAEGQERFAAEVQAQLAARLANRLAVRMASLGEGVQRKHFQDTLEDEAARVRSFRREIGE